MSVNIKVWSKSQPYAMEYKLQMSYAQWLGLDNIKRELFINDILAQDFMVEVSHDIEQVENE